VSRRFIVKDATMRSKLILIALSSALAACVNPNVDQPDRGLASVNVPVVTTADYVFDAAAPGGALAPGEPERLSGWFQGLGLGYGDTVYVDGGYAPAARSQVAAIAGRYGMLVTAGAPATAGIVPPGSVRVVVARRRAEVPGCPNWRRPAAPDASNRSMSNYGCSVNSNIAAMVANPEDLLHGREGSGVTDTWVANRAIEMYRTTPPSGTKGLQAVTPGGGK
jgi:pilus assembly protein CpaD